MWNAIVVLVIIITLVFGSLYLVNKFCVWLSRFALVQMDKVKPTVLCKWCPQGVHGCTHFGGVPSTWEHVDGSHFCKNPFPGAPPNAEAWHR